MRGFANKNARISLRIRSDLEITQLYQTRPSASVWSVQPGKRVERERQSRERDREIDKRDRQSREREREMERETDIVERERETDRQADRVERERERE